LPSASGHHPAGQRHQKKILPQFAANSTDERNGFASVGGYLSKKTGEPVEVPPLVVLSGCFVKISEKGNLSVWANYF
jgi:hypothetical protein